MGKVVYTFLLQAMEAGITIHVLQTAMSTVFIQLELALLTKMDFKQAMMRVAQLKWLSHTVLTPIHFHLVMITGMLINKL